MSIRYENAHFWRNITSGTVISFPGDGPTVVKTVVKATVPVIVMGATVTSDGEGGQEFLVGYCLPGDTPVRVSHGYGVQLSFVFKAGEVAIYDDREELTAVAPVGESFTRFEKMGLRIEDPLQVLLHRDQVRKRLERIAGGDQPDGRMAALEAQVASLTALLERAGEVEPEVDTEQAAQ